MAKGNNSREMTKGNVEIIEQPAEKSFRFRYESEGRNSGSILGVNSTHQNPSYPKIRVHNYTGPICVVVSCVTNESKFVIFKFVFPSIWFICSRFECS